MLQRKAQTPLGAVHLVCYGGDRQLLVVLMSKQ